MPDGSPWTWSPEEVDERMLENDEANGAALARFCWAGLGSVGCQTPADPKDKLGLCERHRNELLMRSPIEGSGVEG